MVQKWVRPIKNGVYVLESDDASVEEIAFPGIKRRVAVIEMPTETSDSSDSDEIVYDDGFDDIYNEIDINANLINSMATHKFHSRLRRRFL